MSASFTLRPGHFVDPHLLSPSYAASEPLPALPAYSDHSQIAQMAQEGLTSGTMPTVGVLGSLESVLVSARQMELSLGQEKKKVRQLQEELRAMQASYDRILHEERIRTNELNSREYQLKMEVQRAQESEKNAREKLQTVSNGYRQIAHELQQYKQAWAGVLQREKEARQIIQDSQRSIERSADAVEKNKALGREVYAAKARADQMETHAKAYQAELQNALVRLHASEAKLQEVTKECESLTQNKKTFEADAARIEKRVRERLEWEFLQEREEMKEKIKKESFDVISQERDKIQGQIQAQLQAQFEEHVSIERTRYELICEGLEGEIRRVRAQNERAQAEIAELEREAKKRSEQFQEEVIREKNEKIRAEYELKSQERARLEDEVLQMIPGSGLHNKATQQIARIAEEQRVLAGKLMPTPPTASPIEVLPVNTTQASLMEC